MIVNLKPYPKMKDSGVEWLGEVPEHWDVRRLKYLLRERDKRSADGSEQLLRVSQYTGVTERKAKDGTDEPDTRAASLVGYKSVSSNELVVNIMLAWNGSMGVSGYSGICSPAYCVYRFNDCAVPWYFHNLLRSPLYKARIKAVSTGVVESRLRLYTDDLYRLEGLLPPLPEQVAIVRYLDYVNRRVRRLVRAKRKLIALLTEQKQAIIHRVVTRGLDPDVPLKDSGVEWLGELPEHWEVRRIQQITDPKRPVMYGIVLPGPNVDDGVYIVKGGNCEPGRLRVDRLSKTTHEIEARYVRSRLVGNDIVFAIRGGVGAAELVPEELAGANLTQDAARIAPTDRDHPTWFLYAVRAPRFQSQIQSMVIGATVRGINIRDLRRAQLVRPPIAEQTTIARYLDETTADIDSTVARANREIALLNEYRTRLIADVVTGKFDVREAAAALPEGDPLDAGDDLGDVLETNSDSVLDAIPEEAEA